MVKVPKITHDLESSLYSHTRPFTMLEYNPMINSRAHAVG
jgi:hypothetical protein